MGRGVMSKMVAPSLARVRLRRWRRLHAEYGEYRNHRVGKAMGSPSIPQYFTPPKTVFMWAKGMLIHLYGSCTRDVRLGDRMKSMSMKRAQDPKRGNGKPCEGCTTRHIEDRVNGINAGRRRKING